MGRPSIEPGADEVDGFLGKYGNGAGKAQKSFQGVEHHDHDQGTQNPTPDTFRMPADPGKKKGRAYEPVAQDRGMGPEGRPGEVREPVEPIKRG